MVYNLVSNININSSIKQQTSSPSSEPTYQQIYGMSENNSMSTCANCGKGEEESEKLKTCTACKMVEYCSVACQKAHRPLHKKACKKRAAELHDEQLFKDIELDDCPLCFLPMPYGDQTTFMSCCGKRICDGCIYAFENSGGRSDLCAFCRTPGKSA